MSDIEGGSVEEQLMLLKGITRMSGVLHDAQVYQLKMYPLAMLPHCESAEVRVDTNKRNVNFVLKTKGKKPKDLATRLEYLDATVKWLLGDEWQVGVSVGDTQIFRGKRISAKQK